MFEQLPWSMRTTASVGYPTTREMYPSLMEQQSIPAPLASPSSLLSPSVSGFANDDFPDVILTGGGSTSFPSLPVREHASAAAESSEPPGVPRVPIGMMMPSSQSHRHSAAAGVFPRASVEQDHHRHRQQQQHFPFDPLRMFPEAEHHPGASHMMPDRAFAEQFEATGRTAVAGASRQRSQQGGPIAAAAAPGTPNVLDAMTHEMPNPNRARSKWTPEEDRKVLELVEKYGRNWGSIAQDLKTGQTGKQVRERWKNQLRPGINRVRASQISSLSIYVYAQRERARVRICF